MVEENASANWDAVLEDEPQEKKKRLEYLSVYEVEQEVERPD